jgi:hypothetical protein
MSESLPLPVSPPPGDLPAAAGAYEYRVLILPRGTTRAQARRLLAEHAEYGHWELARVLLYMGGARRVWLRRKIIRVVRTA